MNLLDTAETWTISQAVNSAKYPGLFLVSLALFCILIIIPEGRLLLLATMGRLREYRRLQSIRTGAGYIFETRDRLSFREIAIRWQNCTNDPGYHFEENYTRLIQAFWLGQFEGIKDDSVLTVEHPLEMQHSEECLTISPTLTPCRFAISHEMMSRNQVTADYVSRYLSNALENGVVGSLNVDLYRKYATLRYEEYDTKCIQSVWDALVLKKVDFLIWLDQSKIRLPKEWKAA